MGIYTVSQIPLAPIPGVHNGTGHQHDPGRATVVPGSVPGSGLLQFTGMDLSITTLLFAVNANVVPNWIGVAVPDGLTDFTRPNLFFHPTPGQAGYSDADYPTKAGPWPKLFYYMERLGYQIAGSGRGQMVVMPFLTEAATSDWILPANWQDIITDILASVSGVLQPQQTAPAAIAQVVVSSFSSGILYSHAFRATAAGLPALLGEIWDFDGSISSVSQYSKELRHGQSVPVVQYDQNAALGASSYHLPVPRWAGFYDSSAIPKTVAAVHPLIRDFMFLHAGTVSSVGSAIQPDTPAQPPQSPPLNGPAPAGPTSGLSSPGAPAAGFVPGPASPDVPATVVPPSTPLWPPQEAPAGPGGVPQPASQPGLGWVRPPAMPLPIPATQPVPQTPATASPGCCRTSVVSIAGVTALQAITAISSMVK